MAFGPQPYVPVRNVGPRAYVPPPQDINTLIANLQAQQAARGVPAGGFGNLAGTGVANQLPLTRTLPQVGSAAGDVSALYARPPAAGQLPLTRTLPKIGPGAGDVSNLLAPKALPSGVPAISNVSGPNPAASRAIRGGWEYTPTSATPNVPTGPGGMSTPSGVMASTADDLAGLYSAKPAYSSIFSKAGLSELAGMRPSIDWKQMGKRTLGGAALSMGLGALANTLIPADATMPGGTPLRAMGNNAASGAGLGFGMFGPVGAVGGAFKGATNAVGQDMVDQAAREGNGVGILAGLGRSGPSTEEATGDDFLSKWNNWSRDLKNSVTGIFGGGDEGGDEQAQTEDAAPRDYSFNSIRQTASQMGLDPQTTSLLEQKYNSTVAYMKGNPTISIMDPATGQIDEADKKQFEDMGYKVDARGNVAVDDNYIQAAAWNEAYAALPTAQAQALQTADFARRQAALQAAIMEVIPQFTQPFYDTANMGYGSLGEMISGLPPEQQAAGQQMVDSGRMWSGRMGDAVAASLANMPAYLAMNQQVDQANSMAAQIQQAQNQQALAAMYPDLFGQQQSSSSGLTLDDLANAGG